MSPDDLATGGNLLLAAVPAPERERIAAEADRVTLPIGAVLFDPDTPIAAALLPERGLVSLIKREGHGGRTELAVLGRESVVGCALLLADGRSPYQALVQVEALVAIRIEAARLHRLLAHAPALHALLLGAAHAQFVQIAEGLASAAWQRIPARLARWLLMCRDRTGSDRIAITHEVMAMMVGAQRTGITAALHELEGQGLIAATRGQVALRDGPALERLADGGYGVTEREQRRLLAMWR